MELIINGLVVTGAGMLAVRLGLSGLHRRYRAFFVFLIFFALQSLAVVLGGLNSRFYYVFYVSTEPLAWFTNAWVVLELYSLVLKDYKGLYTAGRWCLLAAIVIALTGSGASLLLPSHATRQGHLLAFYYVAERAVYLSLVVFLLAILALLTRYPIALNRNTMAHSIIFPVYFLITCAAFLLVSTRGYSAIHIGAYLIEGVNLGALAAWLALLNPAGERCERRVRPAWMPGQDDELAKQLSALNAALLRAVRA